MLIKQHRSPQTSFQPSKWQQFKRTWTTFWSIYRRYERIEELQRLVAWAKRKRLSKVRDHYIRLWLDEERVQFRYQVKHPAMHRSVRILSTIGEMIFPSHQVYRRGAARKYRSNYT